MLSLNNKVFLIFLGMIMVGGCGLVKTESNTNTSQDLRLTTASFAASHGDFRLTIPTELVKQTETYAVGLDPAVDEGYRATFFSSWTIHITDPLTNTTTVAPLYTLTVEKLENPDHRSLPEWIDYVSAVHDEQERKRSDRDGLFGIQQWIWYKSNPMKTSAFTYYFLDGFSVWQFRIDVNDVNPQSTQFQRVRRIVDQIFASIHFPA